MDIRLNTACAVAIGDWWLLAEIIVGNPAHLAWTGVLMATILDMDFKHALLSIFIGTCIAGAIVTSICILDS